MRCGANFSDQGGKGEEGVSSRTAGVSTVLNQLPLVHRRLG